MNALDLNVKVYGDYRSDLFAIEYAWNYEDYLTIFIKGIDYRKEFVEGLLYYVPSIPRELAEKISKDLRAFNFFTSFAKSSQAFAKEATPSSGVLTGSPNN